jgi:hypothetical protein
MQAIDWTGQNITFKRKIDFVLKSFCAALTKETSPRRNCEKKFSNGCGRTFRQTLFRYLSLYSYQEKINAETL